MCRIVSYFLICNTSISESSAQCPCLSRIWILSLTLDSSLNLSINISEVLEIELAISDLTPLNINTDNIENLN